MDGARSQPTGGLSSRTQAAVGALALVALTLLISAWLTHREVARVLEEQTRDQLAAIGARAAEDLRAPLAFASPLHIERIADDAFTHRDVASVRVSDTSGQTVALRLRQDPSRIEHSRALAISGAPQTLRTAEEVRVGSKRLGWACRTPVWGDSSPARLLGYVTVAGDAHADARIAGAFPRAAAAAGVASLGLSGLLAAWGASRLTRPVRRVADAVFALESGKTPADIPPTGPHETRRLAGAFNAMHRSLREARRRLEESNAELERQVSERTAQLEALNEALQQQMREKNDFIRSVGHDLGAPLRNIAGMATMILDEHAPTLPDDAVHWLERIGANVEIESVMLRELVDLSRASERAENLQSIRVGDVAHEVAATLATDLQSHDIELIIAPDLPTLRVDRTDLWMLLQNLTDNAIKYMGDAPTRRIEIGPLVTSGEVRGIVVRDTGPGIPEEEQPRLFRVFHRASTGAGSAGSGVGLSVVQSIVERWGGDVRVDSAPMRGAAFEISVAPDRLILPAQATATPSGDPG